MSLRFLFASLTLFAWATSAHAAVEFHHVQACHGRYGPARTKLEVAPYEELMFRFVIAGLKLDSSGKTNATLTVTLIDSTGRELVQQPQSIRTTLPFGSDSCPGTASVHIGAPAAPGEYQLRVNVEDKLAPGSARFVRKISVRPIALSILNPRFFVDPARTLPGPCGGLVGQTMYLRAQVAEPTRRDGRTAVTLKLRVLDLDGKEVLQPPLVFRREATSEHNFHLFAIDAELPLGGAGEYRLVMTAMDELSKLETTIEMPLSIHLP